METESVDNTFARLFAKQDLTSATEVDRIDHIVLCVCAFPAYHVFLLHLTDQSKTFAWLEVGESLQTERERESDYGDRMCKQWSTLAMCSSPSWTKKMQTCAKKWLLMLFLLISTFLMLWRRIKKMQSRTRKMHLFFICIFCFGQGKHDYSFFSFHFIVFNNIYHHIFLAYHSEVIRN